VDEVRAAGIIPGGLALTDTANLVTVLVGHFLGVRSARGGRRTSALLATCAPFFATIRSLTLGAEIRAREESHAVADPGLKE
jgi:hypothetical protein